MIEPKNITLGVIFTGKRSSYLETFFQTCIFNDTLSVHCTFVIVDNATEFPLQELVEKWFKKHFPKNSPTRIYVRNEKIESLPYNHNLIYFNAPTEYVIHNNDEVYFKKHWLHKTLEWINSHSENQIAHLCRCSKGYYKSVIPKWGYFNIQLSGKEQSDSDCEYREAKYLEERDITPQWWRMHGDAEIHKKIIGGYWRQEYFEPLKCQGWCSEICVQPINNMQENDSNNWLPGNSNLSENNKNVGKDNWHLVGAQGLEDISNVYEGKY